MFAEQLQRMVHFGHRQPSAKAVADDDRGGLSPSQNGLNPALRVFDAPGMFVGNELAQVGECLLDWPPAPGRSF